MKWNIVVVGKPSLTWAKDGVADYLRRLKRVTQLEVNALKGKALHSRTPTPEAGEKSLRIVLDERGKHMSSKALAGWITRHQLSGTRRISVFIGGSDGHSDELRKSANETWALSTFTIQHELALVVFLEQLYRAYSIVSGSPYHRE